MVPTTRPPLSIATLLPHPLPGDGDSRIALFAIRRMGAHGLHDARAASALFGAFGHGFRRPLTLMRALMAQLAADSVGTIAIAPCCCARMTAAEAALIAVVSLVETRPERARLLLADLLGTRRVEATLAAAAAVAAAFADLGRPVIGR